jgi:predicted kinase
MQKGFICTVPVTEYDDVNKLIMMVGIPGSGKSTYAEKIAKQENAVVVSSDKMREELFGDVSEQRKNRRLFGEMYKRVSSYLSQGRNVILDSTNLSSSKRSYILRKFKPYLKVCYYIEVPLSKAINNNMNRERHVPEHVIRRSFDMLQEPAFIEGWDEIHIISDCENQ